LNDDVPKALRYRELAWRHLREEVFDLLVIGGGINGAAVARDAAMRGLSVAVIERGDFGSGTSSRSSKLIHGGVRYLEHGDVGLVLEACRERELLRAKLAPHLVRAQPFVFPIYDDDEMPVWQLRAGLLLYDMLAGFRNVRVHRALSRDDIRAHEPALNDKGLRGGALYYDCWTDDARLTLETMVAARDGGATVLNYAEIVELDKDSAGRLASARVRDVLGTRTTRVRARSFVNVTGPWLDTIRRLDDPGAPPLLGT
jgi:glycerol-3-phosphate dehydrogenase